MSILQRSGRWAVNGLFHISLLATVGVISVVAVFGTSAGPKQALARSGVYQQFVNASIDTSKSSNHDTSIPLDDPAVRAIFNQAFSPRFMQASSEAVIDATYGWLEGRNKTVAFVVDFRPSKLVLGEKLSAYAFNCIATLPLCQEAVANYDPFKADCRTPLISITSEQTRLAQEIARSPDILPEAVLTDHNLPKASDGRRLDQAFSFAPSLFRWASSMPYILGGIAALLGLLLVRIQNKGRQGVRSLAFGIISDAVFWGSSVIIFGKIIPVVAPVLSIRLQGGELQNLLDKPVQILSDHIENTVLLCCFMLLLVAASLLLLERGTRPAVKARKRRKPSKTKQSATTVPIQSSEESRSRPPRKPHNKKYRNIPKKEF